VNNNSAIPSFEQALAQTRRIKKIRELEQDEKISFCGEIYAECVKNYDTSHDCSFITYYNNVLAKRLPDFLRQEQRFRGSFDTKHQALRQSAERFLPKFEKSVRHQLMIPTQCLTKSQKRVINLLLEGYSRKDVALQLGWTVGTVNTSYHNALKRMREHVRV
jgi:DNA-directed RNA polymerase specialized sigma24 family protein